jgi:hypothetical protein
MSAEEGLFAPSIRAMPCLAYFLFHFQESTRMKLVASFALALVFLHTTMKAQSGFFERWESRVRATSAKQPVFPIPVIAPSSQLVQLVRFDVLRQIAPARTATINIDNGKGLNLIPFANTEIDINLPPLIEHHAVKTIDGTGDFSVVYKYRPFASPSEKHNYTLGGQALFTVPTGSYKNGTAVSTIQPTVMGGKGFGPFDVQSTIGAILPNSSVASIGRTVSWNTTAQYRLGKIFFPEIESNATFYHGGANDGKSQNFVSPGLMISKFKLRKEPKDRLALIVGGSVQIATSTYHAYNHALVFTSRFAF